MTSIPDTTIEAGEAALEQGNYTDAIAIFQTICENELDPMVISRAQQALVVAYCNNQQYQDAIAFCEQLCENPTPETAWAVNTFADLTRRYGLSDTVSPEEKADNDPLLPVTVETPSANPEIYTPGRQWRNAERAERWKRLKRLKMERLWLVELVSVLALFWIFRFTIQGGMTLTNKFLLAFPYLRPFQPFYRNPTNVIIGFLVLLLIASPWLLDWLLTRFYGLEAFSLPKLAARSPEASKTVQKLCRQCNLPLPQLKILPTNAPVAMTYGNWRRNARIVISEGLLQSLDDSEVATMYAAQLGHIAHWDFILMSGIMTLLQIPFTLYRQTNQWGDRVYKHWQRRFPKPPKPIPEIIGKSIPPLIKGITAFFSALFYSLYWFWRVVTLWFSRRRVYYSDRFAAEYTGNPNALTRAVLKIAIGLAHNIEDNEQTSYFLESFDLFMPVSHRQALSVGSLPDYTPFETVLAWECTNPYRHWLTPANSHPLLGDRLYLLSLYAYFWKLQPEIDLPKITPAPKTNKARLTKLKNSYLALPLLQSALLAGVFFGVIFRAILWSVGMISDFLNIWQLIWLHNAGLFLDACVLFSFSLCIIIWINGYFPDIRISPTRGEPRIQDLLADQKSVPPDSQGVRLTGKLIGREGISNWLAQDLILKTSTGSIKVHFFSRLGPLGNLLPLTRRPCDLIDQKVTVIGWFRRGGTPWIDIDTLRTTDEKVNIRSGYPVWVTILTVAAATWGAYLITKV